MYYDVLVVGGGHAGVEAAAAAERCGASVALVTFSRNDLGTLSCNPAIGGLGKGHIVREIDALGGLMARFADAASIGYRLLNRRKGPAVRGPRAQVDRRLYHKAVVEWRIGSSVEIIEGEVSALRISGGRVHGVLMADGSELSAAAVVLATGTFLGGKLFCGPKRREGGRSGGTAATALAGQLREACAVSRLKTGTPPRLDGRTIDWSAVAWQHPDAEPCFFSALADEVSAPQVSCGITHTNGRSHELVASNLSSSATFGGEIEGRGPRYCPSIEDKVVRFADRDAHQIFLEPEGLDSHLIYPNGISTALPLKVQEQLVRSIDGLHEADIVQPGYAVEYDFLDPRGLAPDLQSKDLRGLYMAGQINGTTGYEEAAGQGLVAGANAARALTGKPALRLDRANSYIGVMVDDLVTQGVSEPYRMFTSRAEYRLMLRTDNAHRRLTPIAIDAGLAGAALRRRFEHDEAAYSTGRSLLEEVCFSPAELSRAGLKVRQDGVRRSLFEWLRFPELSWQDLQALLPELELEAPLVETLSVDAQYEIYLRRQEKAAARLRQEAKAALPADIDYRSLPGLSNEMAERLSDARPTSLGAASRVPGVTPAALTILLAYTKQAA